MFALLALIVIAAVTTFVLVSRRSEAFRPVPIDESLRPALRRARSATRIRAFVSLGASIMTFAAVCAVNQFVPQSYGLPLLLAPGTAAIVGLVVFALFPPVTAEIPTRRREANLVPRRLWSYAPGWAYLLPTVAAAAVILFATFAGVSSRPGYDGAYREIGFDLGRYSSAAGPYPGWFYGVPLITMTVCLLAATVLALHSISAAPRPTLEPLGDADRLLRVYSTRTVMKLSSGALFTYFGGALLFAGLATTNAAHIWIGDTFVAIQPATALGVAEAVLGLAFLLLGGFLLAVALVDVSKLPKFSSQADSVVESTPA